MIPLVSIGKFISTVFSIFVAYRAYGVWQKEKENESLKCFFRALVLTTLIFSFYVFFPFLEDLYLIQVMFYLHDILAILITFYFTSVFLKILDWQRFQKIFLWLILLGMILLVPFYLKHFNRAIVFNYNFLGLEFIGWVPDVPLLIRIFLFTALGTIGLAFAVLFLKKTFSFDDSRLKARGIFFVLGIVFILLAGIVSIICASFASISFLLEIIHIFFSILSSIFFFLFLFYKKQSPQWLE